MKIAKTNGQTRQTPIGPLTVYEHDGKITAVDFGMPEQEENSHSPLLDEAHRQIAAYLNGELKRFNLPCDLSCGTPFRQQIWHALTAIPYGQTVSYAEMAEQIGNPRAVRAVGMANHCNPIPIIIPCHRVIGKNGSLTGYAGGLPIKSYLLKLEKEHL